MTVYTLFGQPATPATIQADTNNYTFGVQFKVTVTGGSLTGLWFYSPPGATVLPNGIQLYAVSGQSLVHSETPSWSGAAGSGWVRASFASPPVLVKGASYKAALYQSTSSVNWYSRTANYWDTGAGSGGITNGPLTATNAAGGDGGQDTFLSSAIGYPTTSSSNPNYWIDPEVTVPSGISTLFGQATPTGGATGGSGATTGNYGLQFSVSSASVLQGIWFYSPSGATVIPDVIGIFDTSTGLIQWQTPSWSTGAGTGWIFASFAAPVLLSTGINYKAVIHEPFSSGFWNYTTASYWSSGPGSAGITSGVLSAPNDASAASFQNSYVAGSSIGYPNLTQSAANIWMDVQVTAAPANTYTAFKQQAITLAATNDNGTYTFGMQFQVSSAFNLNAVWFYSPFGSGELPEGIGVYHVGTQALVHSETPTWSGPSGSGWVRAAFSSPPALNATTDYKVIINKTGGTNNWYAAFAHYWDTTGPGTSGLTNGPMTMPNNASALNGQSGGGGQDVFNVGATLAYPNTAFQASNYWVDAEIGTSGGPTAISVSDFAGVVELLGISTVVPVLEVAGMVEARSITAAVPVVDIAGVVESPSITATLAVQDFAGSVESESIAFLIFVSDVAGSKESTPAITASIPAKDYAGMVESMAGSVGLSVSDVAAGLDAIFRAGVVGTNLHLPAIVFMAGTYTGDS